MLQDVRYALRGLRRQPGFAVVAVVIFGLGIGANTAVFSVANPLVLRPLPFPDGDRLVWITKAAESEGLSLQKYPVAVYEEFRRQSRTTPADPITFAAMTLLLVTVSLVAGVPAQRAARIQPMEALRAE
jgi:ABC-type antimicrobial peptide transport system permease subunit